MHPDLSVESFVVTRLLVEVCSTIRTFGVLVPLAWSGALTFLFYLYVAPPVALPIHSVGGLDKILHAIAHAVMVAIPLALVANRRLKAIMITLAIASAFTFEFAQLLVPERRFDAYDLAANFVGLLIGACAGCFLRDLAWREPKS